MKKLLALLIAGSMAVPMAACGADGDSKGNDGGDSGKDGSGDLRKVTVVLDYVPNTNHTGLYAAKDLGYYEEAGLDVEIIEPAADLTTTLIAAGKGDFGVSYQEDVTSALALDEPLPIKAIAAVIQHNTSGFASFKDKNINTPKDFEGKTYAGWGAPSEAAVIKAVMNAGGADFSTVNMVTADGVGYEVMKGKVDFMWFFWAWDGLAAEMAGVPINYMEVRELDPRLDYYTPVIIANNQTIENDPEMVQNFMNATKKGYEYVIANPKEAADIIHKYADTYDLELLQKSQEYLAGKYSEDSQTWGLMKDEVWDNYTAFMKENGLIDREIKASDCYTNQFLQ